VTKHLDPCVKDSALLVVSLPLQAIRQGGALFLDDKAVAGLKLYSTYWHGRVRCIFREGGAAIDFGSRYDPASLPFEIVTIAETAPIPDALLHDAVVVLASGDNHYDLPLAKQCRMLHVPLVFGIEYTLETRLQIIALGDVPLINKLWSIAWAIKTEMVRRRAFALTDALQANGTPAAKSFAKVNRDILMYFDSRMSMSMIASDSQVAAKAKRCEAGEPLRLAFSGRLERSKGADQLVPLAQRLVARGVDFRLDVFGKGSLAAEMRDEVQRNELTDYLTIHEPLQFATELVPWMRDYADLFICCHPQADPSCTYLETLGCGVPIVGYLNPAFEGIMHIADVGWLVPTGDLDALADAIATLAVSRETIAPKARAALAFAAKHNFEETFFNRVAHLRKVAFRNRCAD
jgi:colanic acid/amylovoran biosynthesis glycosyltransferase